MYVIRYIHYNGDVDIMELDQWEQNIVDVLSVDAKTFMKQYVLINNFRRATVYRMETGVYEVADDIESAIKLAYIKLGEMAPNTMEFTVTKGLHSIQGMSTCVFACSNIPRNFVFFSRKLKFKVNDDGTDAFVGHVTSKSDAKGNSTSFRLLPHVSDVLYHIKPNLKMLHDFNVDHKLVQFDISVKSKGKATPNTSHSYCVSLPMFFTKRAVKEGEQLILKATGDQLASDNKGDPRRNHHAAEDTIGSFKIM